MRYVEIRRPGSRWTLREPYGLHRLRYCMPSGEDSDTFRGQTLFPWMIASAFVNCALCCPDQWSASDNNIGVQSGFLHVDDHGAWIFCRLAYSID